MKTKFYYILSIFSIIVFFINDADAEKTKIDSLKAVLKTAKDDTNKVNILIVLADEFPTDTSIMIVTQALQLAEKIKWQLGIGKSQLLLGVLSSPKNDNALSLEHYSKALAIWEQLEKSEINPNSQIIGLKSKTLNCIGLVYSLQGDYTNSLDYIFKALKLAEETGDKRWQARILSNIAVIYNRKGDYPKARDYSLKAVTIAEVLRDIQLQADIVGNIAGFNYTQFERQKIFKNIWIGSFAVVLAFAGIFFYQRNKIKISKRRNDELLLNILPAEVAEELKAKGSADAKQFDEVTVMFTDFKGFTQISERLTPSELVAEIHTCFKAFDNIITKYNIEKIKTIGDSYMCAGGLPVTNTTNAVDVVNAAIEIQQFMQKHLLQRQKENKEPFEIRIGVNTGAVVAGIVGVKKFAYDIWGDTVNIASRMESSGEAGKVNVSGTTYELIKDKFQCSYRGKVEAKNKGMIDMYFVDAEIS